MAGGTPGVGPGGMPHAPRLSNRGGGLFPEESAMFEPRKQRTICPRNGEEKKKRKRASENGAARPGVCTGFRFATKLMDVDDLTTGSGTNMSGGSAGLNVDVRGKHWDQVKG